MFFQRQSMARDVEILDIFFLFYIVDFAEVIFENKFRRLVSGVENLDLPQFTAVYRSLSRWTAVYRGECRCWVRAWV
jgi:hypothetical protein